MKNIYVLLTRSRTFVSRLIGKLTQDKYTHVSLSFEDNLMPMYSFSRTFVYSPLPAHIAQERLNDSFYHVHHNIPYALYKLDVDDDVYMKIKKDVETMYEHKNQYNFNVFGLFLCRMGIKHHRKNKMFCSQFVSHMLHSHGLIQLKKDPSLVRPSDFTEMPELVLISEGILPDLKHKLGY